MAVLQTQQGVLTAGSRCDDTPDQDHLLHVFLLGCHILEEHVRSHPDEQAAEKPRRTAVRGFRQPFRKSSSVLLMHITAKMLKLILEKLHRHVKPFSRSNREAIIVIVTPQ